MEERMYLIAGLGNPELRYAATRHNVGFEAAARLSERYAQGREKRKFQSLMVQGSIEGEPCIILRPQTYMNNSGIAVREAAAFYKIPAERILVIYDDIALPLGALRLRKGGSAGGHNGIKSIIAHLGTQDFPRIRIGVGGKPDGWDLADYVLGAFTKEEQPVILETLDLAVKAAAAVLVKGMDKAMNEYNQKR